jgi:outer membrane protein OmpA-like peptidoglycan-associated protein
MNLAPLGLAAVLAFTSTLTFAHGDHGSNAVWRDKDGGLVLSTNGECVRAIDFASLNKDSCHDQAEPAPAMVKVEPATAVVVAEPPKEPVYILQREEYTLLFDTDQANLNTHSLMTLADAVSFAKNAHHLLAVQIAAHTDSRGSEAYNFALSQQRADVVKAYLTENGINVTSTMAMGEKQLVMVNGQEDLAASRRADITIRAKVVKKD